MAKKITGVNAHTEITIDQVAKAAKVSPATVSRVLNGTAKVSAEKEKAVR
jgi:LacI family transcriptional regulator